MPNERSFKTDVANLKACVKDREIEGPSLIYVGLDWDEAGLKKPKKVQEFPAEETEKAEEPEQPHGDRIPLWIAG